MASSLHPPPFRSHPPSFRLSSCSRSSLYPPPSCSPSSCGLSSSYHPSSCSPPLPASRCLHLPSYPQPWSCPFASSSSCGLRLPSACSHPSRTRPFSDLSPLALPFSFIFDSLVGNGASVSDLDDLGFRKPAGFSASMFVMVASPKVSFFGVQLCGFPNF